MSEELELLMTLDVSNTLGECVYWHNDSHSLWWTDIHESRLYRFDWQSQQLTQWQTPKRLTAFSLVSAEPLNLLVSFAEGFALYQPETGRVQWLATPEADRPGHRFNDGRVDPQGYFWSGTMQDTGNRQPVGTLYRLEASGARPVLTGLTIPNALCWSPDGQYLYHADTPSGCIRRFNFDADHGTLSEEQLFASVPCGYPDGAITDADGYLLCALFGGSAVARFAPDGALVALHSLPVSQPTCVALGGPQGDLLFVTSATEDMTQQQREQEPMAGHLLVYASPYRAKPEPKPDASSWPAVNR